MTANATFETKRATRSRPVYMWLLVSCLFLVGLVSFLAPWISGYSPTVPSADVLLPPSTAHWLGTNELGFDVLSRTLWGGRYALVVSILAVILATVVGTILGVVAGYTAGLASSVIMRVMDMLLGFPALLLALLLVAIVGSGLLTLSSAIAVAFVPIFTRIIYSSSLRVRAEGYVLAARIVGARTSSILTRHVLPAVRAGVLVTMSSSFGWALLISSTLSFLGLGVKPPTPDWGSDLSDAQSYLRDAWWMSVAPGVAITICILLANQLGDQLTHFTARSEKDWDA